LCTAASIALDQTISMRGSVQQPALMAFALKQLCKRLRKAASMRMRVIMRIVIATTLMLTMRGEQLR
jgi:hypothetical protein